MRTHRPLPLEPVAHVLSRALRDDHLLTDVQVVSVCGEPDIRLVACQKGGDVAVELLLSPVDSPPPDCWHAVQVRGEDRQVWRGPPHDAPPGEVVLFVKALLAGHCPRVRYPLLG